MAGYVDHRRMARRTYQPYADGPKDAAAFVTVNSIHAEAEVLRHAERILAKYKGGLATARAILLQTASQLDSADADNLEESI
jgi:hypothetical protein